jgi:hypothetical protein
MRHSAFIVFCLLAVVAMFVVVPRCIRPVSVGMSEQRVTALLTNQWWFLPKPRWFRDDQRHFYFLGRKFFAAEQYIIIQFQPGGTVTNVSTTWKWRL